MSKGYALLLVGAAIFNLGPALRHAAYTGRLQCATDTLNHERLVRPVESKKRNICTNICLFETVGAIWGISGLK